MSDTPALLFDLHCRGVHLWVDDGGELRYRAPKGVLSAAQLAELRVSKADVVRFLKRAREIRRDASPSPALVIQQRPSRLPLSYAQERLWLLEQLGLVGSAYNIPAAVRLQGILDVAALDRSFAEVLHRHEGLRTHFEVHDDVPHQVIGEFKSVALEVVDLTTIESAEQRQMEARRHVGMEALHQFDFECGPLFQVKLLRLGVEEHVVVVVMHHIVSDGWSIGILIQEVGALYAAFSQGRASPLPELAVQYADYALWQRAWLQGEALQKQVSYWKAHLAGAPAVLELPTDRVRPAVQTYRGANYNFALPAELAASLNELARSEGATLFMVLLAAFNVVLSRWSGQSDIVVGSPMAGRTHRELEGMIGFFINTLALRTDLRGDPSFKELLGRMKETALGAYAHQDLPFEKLLEELRPVRDLSRQPVFQVLFALQNVPRETLELPGLRLSRVGGGHVTSKLDLSLYVHERKDRLEAYFEYATDLFDVSTIERMASHFCVLLQAIVAHPDARLSELSLLDDDERHRVVEDGSAAAGAYPQDKCLHELFAGQAAKSPYAVAVVCEDQQLTYVELDRRSNQLAHHLRGLGVGPETIVGLCVERSIEMVVGLLGILKAGGAYLPLDPSYPLERQAYMVSDAGVKFVLTTGHAATALSSVNPVSLLRLDAEAEVILRHPITPPRGIGVTPQNLVYVLYTSGSTGRPKGVMGTHGAVVNRLHWDTSDPSGEEVYIQKTTPNFIDMLWEVFMPLTRGQHIVIASEAASGDPRRLIDLLRTSQATRIVLVPSLLQAMLEAEDDLGSHLPDLRYWACSGEALNKELVKLFYSQLPDGQLFNIYGTSEFWDACCSATGSDAGDHAVSIGRPISNMQAYVLDAAGEVMPIGVPGELYIGGVGLARGYLGRPGLTGDRFVPSPFAEGERLYRTGDLARWSAAGELEYLGRVDHQLKLRGFRIEPGEIEATLRSHGSVKDAIVVAREDSPGDKRLVAYVIASSDTIVDLSDLRLYLKRSLPDYMVPSAFVVLEALPLTPNGKIDRRALPTPEDLAVVRGEYVAPRTSTEGMLALIWAEVLKLEHVGVHDNFFELGGHSLLATRLMARVRDGFRIELPLRVLFEAPTVAELAGRIEVAQREGLGLALPALMAARRPDALPLSYAQERLWLLEQIGGLGSAYNLPAAVRLQGALDGVALERALAAIVERHEILRTRFTVADDHPVQVIDAPDRFALQTEDVSELAEGERAAAARERLHVLAKQPFDLERDPLFRAHLLRLSAEEHIALVVMHHIVSDGWSTGVLVREIGALYAAFSQGRASPLPALPVQYADYALWQRGWLQGEALEKQVAYWKQRLAGAPSALELPTDRPRRAVQSHRGEGVAFELPAKLTRALNALAQAEGATLFMVLLAAFNVVLSRWSGQADIVVGSPIAGRTHRELEGLIGFFVNTLTLRTDLSGDRGFTELLGRVKETALGAYAHQDVPFEKLLKVLQPGRDLSRQPVFQVLFALQNLPQETLELPGLTLHRIAGRQTTAKLDLSLYMFERGGRLEGYLEYATDLFERPTIERMSEQLRVLLEGIVACPQAVLSELPVLPEAERHLVVWEWSRAPVHVTRDYCVHELFEMQAAKTPEAIALVLGDQELSYRELDRRSNQLAHYLRQCDVGPDVIVGLCVARSFEMIVGLLAILKAGGAYLPLDPAYPADRLKHMVMDTGTRLLVTSGGEVMAPLSDAVRALRLDAETAKIACFPDCSPPGVGVTPQNLAYVLYTSGSTGRPKGVMGTHGAVVNRLHWDAEDPSGLETYVQKTTPNFIDMLWEVFMPLTRGHRVVIADETLTRDPRGLVQLLSDARVSRIVLVPSLMRALLEAEDDLQSRLPHLRYWACSGEALGAELVALFHDRLPSAQLYNVYGTSEFWDASCAAVVRDADGPRVSIGRPVSNMQAYVLDDGLRAVPVGVAGELYIGGPGLARGYYRRPDLTGDRFVPSPYGDGERLYRTGDLARWRADGELEYLGRRDHQVKLRGFRIELGEIEATLRSHGSVRDVVAVMREDVPGDKRLVAYVAAEGAVDLAELRLHLKQSLPEYMVPSALVVLDGLPLMPNGKVDRKSLPAPEQEAVVRGAYEAPRTPAEELLAGIWAEVLKLDRVGVHDNFFELGGHSLLAMRLMARVRDGFRIELPLRALFEAPTVAELAGHTEVAQREGLGLALPALMAGRRPDALPLSHAQERLWLLDRIEDLGSAYIMPAAVRLQGVLDVAALERSFAAVVERHEILRTRFVVVDDSPVQIIDPTGLFRLPDEDLSELAEDERGAASRQRVRLLAQQPFDLERGPLFRAYLLRLSEEEHVAVVVMHHIISDGWSIGVLIREVGALYAAFSQGRASPLPALPVQYADYALWQRDWLQGEALQKQLSYWKQRLSGAPAALDLPTDRQRAAIQSYRGAYHRFSLSTDLTRGLNELARAEGATLYMVLLAGFQLLLKRYSGQDDIVVGSPIAGRTHRELEGLIGFFVNTLVVRTELSGELNFRQLLKRVKEAALGAYAHQDLPFEKLVEELRPARDLSRQPIFQVLLALQNVPQERFDLPGLTLSRTKGVSRTSKFDLSLYLHETPNGLWGYFEYATDLFDGSTIARLADHYRALLEQIVADPVQSCSRLEASVPPLGIEVTISSTFTGDALVDPLRFWCERAGLTAHIRTTGFNRVLQSLLADRSNPLGPNRFHVILLRLGDWGRRPAEAEGADASQANINFADIEHNVDDFVDQLRTVSGSGAGHYLIGLCPEPIEASTGARNALRLDLIGKRLLAGLRDVPRVAVLPLDHTLGTLGVSEIHDPYLDRIADIPYTPAFFVAAAASAMRALFEARREPYKVIVADCDNTLWRGICGEDGPLGVTISPECRLLQEFLIRQAHNGVLLCLCSRNNEADVVDVFRSNKDMLLSWDDIVSHRIGWGAKSSAIAELAAELDLALDSFVFLDDDSVECAKIQQDCPEVLTLTVPQSDGQMDSFLDRLWAFDGAQPTAEDRKRSQRYRQEWQRREVRQTSASLQSFIAGLELKVELRSIAEQDSDRVVQMMERTTQFNTTGLRLAIGEVRQLVGLADRLCLIVEVSDRFGDYGKSALLVVECAPRCWTVTGLALSCRILGRDVEYRIVELLAGQARTAGVTEITFQFQQTMRNAPARSFLHDLRKLAQSGQQGDGSFTFSSDQIVAALQRRQTAGQQPEIVSNIETAERTDLSLPALAGELDFRAVRRRFYRLIALERRSMSEIGRDLGAIEVRKKTASDTAPRTPAEELLAGIWAEVLKLERVGVHDNFFELGGHSLLATRLMARVRDGFRIELPLRALFEAPTVAELAGRIEVAQREGLGLALPALMAGRRPDALPLSYAQERLWLLEQIEDLGSAYIMPAAVRLQGVLDVAALERSFAAVVERHEILRTRFVVVDDNPVQIIDPTGLFRLSVEDLSELAEDERAPASRQRVQLLAQQPFDLERGPLFRAHLLRLSAEEHTAVMVMHHIIWDGWSTGVLLQEVGVLYAAFSQGRASPLPALAVQYADYALWQRDWLQGEALEKQLSYWKQRLSGAPAVLDLPTDRPRPAVQSYRGDSFVVALPPELTAPLRELARSEGATLFMVLLAAFNVVLSRWSGQTDIVVGSPIAGRTHRELEGLIGFFVNTLALRTELGGDPSFRELLGRVKEMSLGAYAHQDVPFEKLVAELQPVRDLSRQAIFQVLFNSIQHEEKAPELSALKIERLPGGATTSLVDLEIYVEERAEGRLLLRTRYATDLFERATIERLTGHLRVLLEGCVANPDARLSELALLSEAERRRLVEEWNDTAAEYPKDKCLHELFAAQAAKTPDAVAMAHEGSELSYGELDRRSNQLAQYLRRLGVGPEAIVGLCLDRSPQMVVGLLGVLKAGGAYLPMDPEYPPERLAFMLKDTKAPVVLTQDALLGQLPAHDAQVVRIDADWAEIGAERAVAPAAMAVSDNLAFVIYTSGSTGQPKGVAIRHRSITNYVTGIARAIGPESFQRSALVQTIAAVSAVTTIYPTLLSGGRLDIFGREQALNGDLCRRRFADDAISNLKITPSHLAALHADAGCQFFPSKALILAGEPSPASWIRELKCTPPTRIYNHYASTEAFASLVYGVEAVAQRDGAAILPLGSALANVGCYVLDVHLNLVPAGVPGEMAIGGDCLARGYHNLPGLTAERFVPSPFGDGERLYLTGDLARRRADGVIESLGRIDHQVKIRGFRVELGEIEAALAKHSDVREAVMVAREDGPGDKRLVAYVVGHTGSAVDASELRAHLKRSLPDYMVPSAFVVLDALPMTPNRKLDRRALPAPEADVVVRGEYVAPRNPTEEVLASIWAELLKLDRVGVHDNFFELGGHSLLAMRVIARSNMAFNSELSLRGLFEAQTISNFAPIIDTHQTRRTSSDVGPIRAGSWSETPPLSFAQERIWFLSQMSPESPSHNLPVAFHVNAGIDFDLLKASLTEIVRRHDVLRATVRNVGGVPVQAIGSVEPVAITRVDLSHLEPGEREAQIRSHLAGDAKLAFDMAVGPLYRATLLNITESRCIILFNLHNLICDGWSIEILIREIQATYLALMNGQPPHLPELPFQYADFAHWQRRWMESGVVQKQLEYWTATLADAPSSTDLPLDKDRRPGLSFDGAARATTVPGPAVDQFRSFVLRTNATFFMGLLAAISAMLFRWTGQTDVVIGSILGNRRHLETETLIGCFTNLVPFRSRFDRKQSLAGLLASVRETVLESYDNYECPLEKIIEAVGPVRRLNQNPLFNVGLMLRNQPPPLPENAWKFASIVRPVRTAQLDLRFVATEHAGGLHLTCEYRTDLFETETIDAVLQSLGIVIETAGRSPATALENIEISDALMQQVVRARTRVQSGDTRNEEQQDVLAILDDLESLSDSEIDRLLQTER
jgi:amino acid adenylation domain-containing protein/FkbH-like protein